MYICRLVQQCVDDQAIPMTRLIPCSKSADLRCLAPLPAARLCSVGRMASKRS